MAAILRIAACLASAVACSTSGRAAEILPGPYPAEVERVVDGDTIGARVAIWLNQDLSVLVRIRGIDAPELRGRCAGERKQAREAMLALERLASGGRVVLTEIEGDKFFGRVLADVTTSAGEDVGAALVASGHARTYDGGARQAWCEAERLGSAEGGRDLASLSAPE